MDKLGILKILSALQGATDGLDGSALSSLFKTKPAEEDKNKSEDKKTSADAPAPEKPKRLSSPLLDAMRTHEEFVKRVMRENERRR